MPVDPALGEQISRFGAVEVKECIDRADWVEYLADKYTMRDMVALGDKFSVLLKGSKKQMVHALCDAILSGVVKHEIPLFIRPNERISDWLVSLQKKFIEDIEAALSSFSYPENFVYEVWDMVAADNSEYDAIVKYARERAPRKDRSTVYEMYAYADKKNNGRGSLTVSVAINSGRLKDSHHGSLEMLALPVQFSYTNRDGLRTARTVRVNKAWEVDRAIYFRGYCELREEERTFRLDGVDGEMINMSSGEVVVSNEIGSVADFHRFIGSPSQSGLPGKSYSRVGKKINIRMVLFLLGVIVVVGMILI